MGKNGFVYSKLTLHGIHYLIKYKIDMLEECNANAYRMCKDCYLDRIALETWNRFNCYIYVQFLHLCFQTQHKMSYLYVSLNFS